VITTPIPGASPIAMEVAWRATAQFTPQMGKE
jgi:hypothetical protein